MIAIYLYILQTHGCKSMKYPAEISDIVRFLVSARCSRSDRTQAMRMINNNALRRLFVKNEMLNQIKQRRRCQARFFFSPFKWLLRAATGEKKKKTSSTLHLKSERSCVTEMRKEEGAPFLSLAAGGAPRFIQMLLTQPKTQGHGLLYEDAPAHSKYTIARFTWPSWAGKNLLPLNCVHDPWWHFIVISDSESALSAKYVHI